MRRGAGGRRARSRSVPLLLLLGAPALPCFTPTVAQAESVLEFDDWMQRVEEGSQELQRRIAKRDRDGALDFARELEELYGRMEKFFEGRGTGEPSVRMSREARELAAGAIRHLGQNDFSAARANALRIARGCRACHIEYKPL